MHLTSKQKRREKRKERRNAYIYAYKNKEQEIQSSTCYDYFFKPKKLTNNKN